ncbi:unnamed protein product [Schistocephalus solidus]|uniref:PDZ domain-containing protein n=1 Tax=Schistocephalus solidus TaxID=70667 RepID=A0A183SP49_SCHSO|nr:unnamed protein product [Schistocephalus solidus]
MTRANVFSQNVLLQRNSPNEKFGLTLVYRPSCAESNTTEVYVGEIEEGSVSQRSGLISTGDRIVKINDQEIESREHVIELFAECCQNAKISLMRPRRNGSYRPMPSTNYPLLGGISPLIKEADLRSDFRGRGSDPKMTPNAYAHLPDQDSGMGRTTDESVRTTESSEPEGESDPGCKLANATDNLNWTALTTEGFLGTDHGPRECSDSHSGAQNGNQNEASISSQKKDLLDAELVRLSHLMQSLALHCSNLAYVKRLYSNAVQHTRQQRQEVPFPVAVRPPDVSPDPAVPTTPASAFLPPRCTPRMGTRREAGGAVGGLPRASKASSEGWFHPAASTGSNLAGETAQASNCEKTSRAETCPTSSSASAMALPSLSDGQHICVATTITPSDLATSLPTLANCTTPAAVDLAADSSGLSSCLSMIRAPSSIWSLPEPTGPFSEESLLPRLRGPSPRFAFPRTGSTSANASPAQVKITNHRVANRSGERVGQVKVSADGLKNGDSNNSLIGSNLKSLSGQGSCSGESSHGFYPRQHPNSFIKHGCLSTTPCLSSGGHQYSSNLASLPQSPQHPPSLPPYNVSHSDVPLAKIRGGECQSPPCLPPPLPYPPPQPIPSASSSFWQPRHLHPSGPAPAFPFPPPLGLHPYELYDHFFLRAAHPSAVNDQRHVSTEQDSLKEDCKYSDVLSNIYETPYAYADMVNTTKGNVGNDFTGGVTAVASGANEQMSSLYNFPVGVLSHHWHEGHAVGAPSLLGVGNPGYTHHQSGRTPIAGDVTSPATPGPLMEWVVKKRNDGTRYITRRPIRQSTRTRSRHQTEDRCGLTTDDDAQSELKFGRYWNRVERKKHIEKAKAERRRKPDTAVVDESTEQAYEPTNSKSTSRSQNSTGRCLISLTTV